MKFACIAFPGSNETDMYNAIRELGEEVAIVSHTETNLDDFDCIILPGGASYGGYLRPGALASVTPVMDAVKNADEAGKFILGVSDGFQILLESGLLPGAMLQNESLKFVCRPVRLKVENNETSFTSEYSQGDVITIPVAHGEGNYYCDEQTLQQLKDNKQIVFTYADNPNGSAYNIAGITNEKGNVLGMMPYPERAIDELIGGKDGLPLFQSIIKHWRETNVINA